MTLNLTQADVGKVYVRTDEPYKYTLKAIIIEAAEITEQAVFLDEIGYVILGTLSGEIDDYYLAEYKEPEVYEGWIALFKTKGGKKYIGLDIHVTKTRCLNSESGSEDFIDAIYIKHTIGEK